MRQEPKLFSSDRSAPPPPQDGFRVEPRQAPRARYDDDDDDRPRRRGGFPWKLVIVLVVLVAVAYGGWKVWGMFGGQVAGGGDVPLFTASVDPFKHRPDDPGGMEVPNQDVTVYNELTRSDADQELEQLLPEPEEPISMEPEAADVIEPGEDGVIDVGAVAVGDIQAPEEGAEAIFSADQIEALVDQATRGADDGALPLPAEKPAAPPAPATTIAIVEEESVSVTETPSSGGSGTLSLDDIAASLGVGGEGGSVPATTTTTTVETTVETPTATVTETASVDTTQPAADSGGASWVQIAAYLSRDDAAAAWQRLATNQADLLANVEARVMETTVAGTSFHRLQVGEFATPAEAQRLCDALRQRQIDCMVVGR